MWWKKPISCRRLKNLAFVAIADSIYAGFYVIDKESHRLYFVNEYLKQKKPGIRAGGYLLYGAAGQEYALCLLSAGASGSQRQARLY